MVCPVARNLQEQYHGKNYNHINNNTDNSNKSINSVDLGYVFTAVINDNMHHIQYISCLYNNILSLTSILIYCRTAATPEPFTSSQHKAPERDTETEVSTPHGITIPKGKGNGKGKGRWNRQISQMSNESRWTVPSLTSSNNLKRTVTPWTLRPQPP